jgi:transketolase
MNQLLRRIVDITYQEKLSHLSSTLSAAPILQEIYAARQDDEVVILSNGHAGLALYCVLEEKYGVDPVELLHKHGIHPGRDLENHLYCSTGSLGMGITVAVGRALANSKRKVYVLISDGECAEGSIWESLRFIHDQNIKNIEVYVNINGYAAYDKIDPEYLSNRLLTFLPSINLRYTSVNQYPFLKGINAHYHAMSEEDYKSTL